MTIQGCCSLPFFQADTRRIILYLLPTLSLFIHLPGSALEGGITLEGGIIRSLTFVFNYDVYVLIYRPLWGSRCRRFDYLDVETLCHD